MGIDRLFVCLVACSLCDIVVGTAVSSSSEKGIYFNYNNGGEDWMVGECASRDRQSPIDLGSDAPWSCNPPMPMALHALLSPPDLVRLGFVAATPGAGFAVASALTGGASLLDASSVADGDDSSMLQVDGSVKNGFLPKLFWLPTAPPALMFPGCGGPLGAFFFRYDRVEKPLTIQNNGRSIATDLKGHGLGSLVLDDIAFDVLSVNFHVWSEHTFNGARKPLELHVVHRDPNTNHVVVVAVAFDTSPSMTESEMSLLQKKSTRHFLSRGRAQQPVSLPACAPQPQPTDPGFSDALANLLSFPLPATNEEKSVNLRAGPVDVVSPLLGGVGNIPQGFFQYRGSLTAPPCTEQVTWLVRKDPLIASRSQIEIIRQAIMQSNSNFPNSRSVMPLMGRNILYRVGIQGEAPAPPIQPTAFPQPVVDTHVDFRGITEGKAAYDEAMVLQGTKNAIADVIGKAQQASMGGHDTVDPVVAARLAERMQRKMMGMNTQLPTPSPEVILHRMVNVVADQLEGPERASAIAASMAGIGPAASAPAAAR
mmetsp:Transcript_93451/g.145911  ORF Transcript_93451/g.145911 Transcript_93451/m.145911 type:complete len:539 (+) Transcript_93451:104-1720(+)